MRRILLAVIAISSCFACLSPGTKAQCQSNFSTQTGYTPFDGGISYAAGPNEAGDYLVVGLMSLTNFNNLSTVPLPNAANSRFCDTVPLSSSARYFAYVPTAAERVGSFPAFSGLIYDPTADCSPFPSCALYPGGVITD